MNPFKCLLQGYVCIRTGLLLAMLCASHITFGAELELLPPLFVESSKALAALNEPTFSVGHVRRLGQLNPLTLRALQSTALESPSRFSLLSGRPEVVRVHRRERLEQGLQYYSGSLEGAGESEVALVMGGEMMGGVILIPGQGTIRISPLGDSLHEFIELDPNDLPVCGISEAGAQRISAGKASTELLQTMETKPGTVRKLSQAEPAEREIELMVVYSGQARKAATGKEALHILIHVAVAEANAALDNSGTGVRLRLVHMAEIGDEETGDLGADLARLRVPNDGIMDEVHAWRDTYAADLVCLIVETSSRYEGIALFPTGPEGGFSVLDRFHLTGYGLLAHEVGHNFGCDHDRENATRGGTFDYSYGHRFEVDGEIYRTIMCYAPGWPIAQFSNPLVSFRGVSTGIPEGDPDQADNARTIREMAPIIDGYRGVRLALRTAGDSTIFEYGAAVEIFVEASSSEGAVEKVEFFDGPSLLGQAVTPPYTFVWAAPEMGKHALTARATLVTGMFANADPVIIAVRPQNDDFTRREPLIGSNVVARTVLYAATIEPGEPTPYGGDGGTAWWTWSPPGAGTTRIATVGTGSRRPRAAVFTGTDLGELQLVSKAGYPITDILFQAAAGQEYQISVHSEPDEAPVVLHVTMYDPPPNDAFANAQPITAAYGTIRSSTIGATREAGEPSIGTASSGHSIWFGWTPPSSGQAKLTLTSELSALADLAVFTGSDLSTLELVATSAQASQGFLVQEQTPYWIGVDGPYAEVTLTLTLTGPPPNDSFSRRTPLNSGTYIVLNNLGASTEPGEPPHGAFSDGRSQWWSWRAPSDGGIRFTRVPNGSATGTVPLSVGVYSGSTLTSLIQVASRDFISGFQESLVVPVRRGTNYSIAIDGPPNASRTPGLRFEFKPKPSNDNFAQRQLGSQILRVNGTTLGATAEKWEPHHGGMPAEHSVWLSATFRSNGVVAATVNGSGEMLPRLSVYSGNVLSNLTLVAENTLKAGLRPTVIFPVEAGKAYQMAVDEQMSGFSYSLVANYLAKPVNDDFAKRTPIGTQPQAISGSTAGASSEGGEPDHLNNGGASHSVWYTWTPRINARAAALAGGRPETLNLGSPPDTQALLPEPFVAVYTGASLSELVLVAKGTGSASFDAERNVPYQIAVTGSEGQPGNFLLMLGGIPNNDNFRSASVLFDAPTWVNVSLVQLRSATQEPGEPKVGPAAGHSLWWSWTPRRSGMYVWTQQAYLNPYSVPPRLIQAIYTGTNLAELNPMASNAEGNLTFAATAGTRYYLSLDLQDSRVPLASANLNSILLQLNRAPMSLSPKLRSDDTIEFLVGGGAGQRLALQTSMDLRNWVPVRTFVMPATDYRFYESRSTGANQRFYRVLPILSP